MFNMQQTKVSEYATVMQKLHRIGKIINHTRVKENLRKTHHITDKSLPQCGTSRCVLSMSMHIHVKEYGLIQFISKGFSIMQKVPHMTES